MRHGEKTGSTDGKTIKYCAICSMSHFEDHAHFKGIFKLDPTDVPQQIPDKPCTIEEKPVDLVNHPPHYTFGKYEVIDVLSDWFPEDPLLWQVVKYLARAKHKDNYLQDLKKAQFYLNRAIQEEES